MIFGKKQIIDTFNSENTDDSIKDLFIDDTKDIDEEDIKNVIKKLPDYNEDEVIEKELKKITSESIETICEYHDQIDNHLSHISKKEDEKHQEGIERLKRRGTSIQTNRGVEHSERIENQIIDHEEAIHDLREKLSSASGSQKDHIRSEIESHEEKINFLKDAAKGALNHMMHHYASENASIEDFIREEDAKILEWCCSSESSTETLKDLEDSLKERQEVLERAKASREEYAKHKDDENRRKMEHLIDLNQSAIKHLKDQIAKHKNEPPDHSDNESHYSKDSDTKLKDLEADLQDSKDRLERAEHGLKQAIADKDDHLKQRMEDMIHMNKRNIEYQKGLIAEHRKKSVNESYSSIEDIIKEFDNIATEGLNGGARSAEDIERSYNDHINELRKEIHEKAEIISQKEEEAMKARKAPPDLRYLQQGIQELHKKIQEYETMKKNAVARHAMVHNVRHYALAANESFLLESDADTEEGLEAEEARFKKYEKSAKGKKKKAYDEKIEELEEKKKKLTEAIDDMWSNDSKTKLEGRIRFLKAQLKLPDISSEDRKYYENQIQELEKKKEKLTESVNEDDFSDPDFDEDDFEDYDESEDDDFEDFDQDDEIDADDFDLDINDIIEESELSTADRKELPTKVFGLPVDRKFPLHDEKHVSSAVTYFAKASKSKRKLLAKNINKQAKKFGMKIKVSSDNPFFKYADKDILED
jgi:hypothetical protein